MASRASRVRRRIHDLVCAPAGSTQLRWWAERLLVGLLYAVYDTAQGLQRRWTATADRDGRSNSRWERTVHFAPEQPLNQVPHKERSHRVLAPPRDSAAAASPCPHAGIRDTLPMPGSRAGGVERPALRPGWRTRQRVRGHAITACWLGFVVGLALLPARTAKGRRRWSPLTAVRHTTAIARSDTPGPPRPDSPR